MGTKNLLKALHRLPEAPWSDIKGKPLDDRGLAHRLKVYDIKSKDVRVGGWNGKGYAREDMHDAWKRYLPPLPHEAATSATSATTVPKKMDKDE